MVFLNILSWSRNLAIFVKGPFLSQPDSVCLEPEEIIFFLNILSWSKNSVVYHKDPNYNKVVVWNRGEEIDFK